MTHSGAQLALSIRPGFPEFLDLPWDHPLTEWMHHTKKIVEVPRGISRHPVEFIDYEGKLYALKELPPGLAEHEYDTLRSMLESRLPVVRPVGHASLSNPWGNTSILITQYLEYSQPYRSLLIRRNPRPEQTDFMEGLLDAMAGLLVQLHLAGVYWGDCSLSNTLFRRDAGTLQAYLVDAETGEIVHPISAQRRADDLAIMEENVTGDLADLAASRLLPPDFPIFTIGSSIRRRYQRLWDEITHEEVIAPNERYRIQERIRTLNGLGFSVGELELRTTDDGEKLNVRVVVTDRNFHRDRLHGLTGLETEEMQARKLMNEIQEVRASLSKQKNRSTSMSVAAYEWLERYYQPSVRTLRPLLQKTAGDPAEVYCQMLEHKWYLSEKAQRDVGHDAASQDYLSRFTPKDTGSLDPGQT